MGPFLWLKLSVPRLPALRPAPPLQPRLPVCVWRRSKSPCEEWRPCANRRKQIALLLRAIARAKARGERNIPRVLNQNELPAGQTSADLEGAAGAGGAKKKGVGGGSGCGGSKKKSPSAGGGKVVAGGDKKSKAKTPGVVSGGGGSKSKCKTKLK